MTRTAARLLHGLLVLPRQAGPWLYDVYAHAVLPHAALVRAVLARLAATPDFAPDYLYLNFGHALAFDAPAARLFVATRRRAAFRPLDEVATCTGARRGLGYRLDLTFTDGTRWCARTLVSIEPLDTAESLLAAALRRHAAQAPPPAVRPLGTGAGFTPDA